MQLKITRSQRQGGVLGGKIIFILDMRAEYSEIERNNINKYNLGGEVIYDSAAAAAHRDNAGQHLQDGSIVKGLASLALARMKLSITIAGLQKGVHIECKDLAELLEAENTVRDACKNLAIHLKVASSFDGRVEIVDFDESAAAA